MAKIPALPAGASSQTDDTQRFGKFRADPSGGQKTVLQPRVLVVNVLQRVQFAFHGIALRGKALPPLVGEIHGDTAGNDTIHQ